ncbi:nuclear transport factor 2 family protein [Nocardiopsis alborubida]|uniref:Nuclear transport factor 2 family protein n=1 Tax=Nocardiopsis alborubida TaxID=146802 RepID=A0A7X6RTN3_9ACTN|nr:nuclear transport factor 2 family protein [Nocardiopsis alborubida]NKZ01889.1 nuclear transport factor 2 family protein [Nocardiopsis alborubida]
MPQSPGGPPPPPTSASVSSIGVEHALLSYLYLDRGDPDGYASLVDGAARFEHPGFPVAFGSEEAAALVLKCYGSSGIHRPRRVVAADGDVVVTGVLTRRAGGGDDQEFADLFAITEHGLLSSWRRYHRPTG